MKQVLFSGGGFEVTSSTLKTPRRAYDLRNVEMVSVRQPLLLISGGIGLGLSGFVLAFFRYLYGWEVFTLGMTALLAITGSAMIGTLKVHSLAIRGDEGTLYGRIGTLRKVKAAVERALDERE